MGRPMATHLVDREESGSPTGWGCDGSFGTWAIGPTEWPSHAASGQKRLRSVRDPVRCSSPSLLFVRLSPTIVTQNTRPICPLVALQVKGSIPIFNLLQQQNLKDNTLCKWVSRREDTQIWVMPLLIPKISLLYGYSVGGYRYCVGDPF